MRYAVTLLDSRFQDFGLLVLRVGLGLMFIVFHGGPKMIDGPDGWEKLGLNAGLDFFPHVWGFMAAFAESVGALFLLIGLFSRYALILLIVTMVMATTYHLGSGDGWLGSSRPIELGIVFLALFFIGPGRYSFDAMFRQGGTKI